MLVADGGRAEMSGVPASVRASGPASRLLALAVPRLRARPRPARDELGCRRRQPVQLVADVAAGGPAAGVERPRRGGRRGVGGDGDDGLGQRAGLKQQRQQRRAERRQRVRLGRRDHGRRRSLLLASSQLARPRRRRRRCRRRRDGGDRVPGVLAGRRRRRRGRGAAADARARRDRVPLPRRARRRRAGGRRLRLGGGHLSVAGDPDVCGLRAVSVRRVPALRPAHAPADRPRRRATPTPGAALFRSWTGHLGLGISGVYRLSLRFRVSVRL